MKSMKPWKNPVKDVPPKDSTMNTPGNFEEFTELMRRVVKVKPEPREKPHASPGPVAS